MQIRLKETDIQRAILDFLGLRGHFVWRNNTGAFVLEHKGKKRYFRSGKKGSADILGIQNGTGKMIAIEVKVPGGTPTPDQWIFLKTVTAHGGIAFVATSVDDVISAGL